MLRFILSVLAGFAATAILSTAADAVCHSAGIFPPSGQACFKTGPFVLASAYRVIFQVFGAWLAATIAKDKAKTAVWTIGILGSLLWLLGALLNKGMGPLWYPLLGAALSIPTVLAGLKIYQRRLPK